MSEPLVPTAAPTAGASSLYPADGGAAAAAGADTSSASVGTSSEGSVGGAAGNDTVAGAAGADTLNAGAATEAAGNDTATGADTAAGVDSLTAASYDFKLPENFQADDALTTEAKTVFAAAGVPADKAQGLVDLFGKAMTAQAAAQASVYAAQQTAWLQEVNSLPEFTGPTRETTLASIGKLFDEFGTPEAKAALNIQGVGNNPALVKMMAKIGAALSEGGPTGQGRPRGVNGQARPATVGGSLYENDGKGPIRQ